MTTDMVGVEELWLSLKISLDSTLFVFETCSSTRVHTSLAKWRALSRASHADPLVQELWGSP